MKTIYQYDTNNRKLITSKNVNDDYVTHDGETSVVPTPGLYDPITFDGLAWTGVTRDEWLANQPEPEPVEPSEQDKINAQLMLTDVKNKKDQDILNAQILLQIAKGAN